MSATASLPESEPVPNRAKGYLRKDGAWVSNADTLPFRGTAAGGGYSTVGDLFRFAQALGSGKLLSPKMLAEATKVQREHTGMASASTGKAASQATAMAAERPG
jgi:hypothetical protein